MPRKSGGEAFSEINKFEKSRKMKSSVKVLLSGGMIEK